MSKLEIPEEVKNLNVLMQKLAAFKAVVGEANFPGKKAKVVDDLQIHLHEEYTQIYEKFHNHPFVKAQLEAQAKQQEEDMKNAALLEAEMKQKMEII